MLKPFCPTPRYDLPGVDVRAVLRGKSDPASQPALRMIRHWMRVRPAWRASVDDRRPDAPDQPDDLNRQNLDAMVKALSHPNLAAFGTPAK